MADIKAVDLIAKFQYAIDNEWGYVLGAWHTMWTQAMQNQKVQYMINTYGSNWKTVGKGDKQYYTALNCGKWVGHWVTDCSGLFYWAFKELGGYMYHGSNTMWNKYCNDKGKLSKGARTDGKELKPGTAVFVLKGTNDQRYQLKADSPAKGAATDGGDCGPFGGLYPYVIGGKPAGYPYYTKAVIGTRAENGKINVSLNIKMQNE